MRACCSPIATSGKRSSPGASKLDPYSPELIQPSSIDVRMDRYFRVFENHRYPHIDPAIEQPDLTRLVETAGDDPFVLHPGEFVLASTYEVVSLPDDIAGRLEGKSSLGRLGLLTHSTAGWIDPGFSGHVTLELSNVATLPIKLWPGMKIGQLCLFRTSSPAEHPYGSAVSAPATRTSAARRRPAPIEISTVQRFRCSEPDQVLAGLSYSKRQATSRKAWHTNCWRESRAVESLVGV